MEFEVGETFGIDAGVDEDDVCCESGNVFIEVHDLDATPLGKSCMNDMVAEPPSPDLVDHISLDSLDILHASRSCSPPSHSFEYCDMLLINSHVMLEGTEVDYYESSDTFRGYDPSLDPYSLYLENAPGKIMLSIVFDYSTDFYTTFDKFRRALTIIPRLMFGCSCLHSSGLHAQVFDKLL